ncbi:hypothetical protein JHK86_001347 [Glycine max]|nr:hypothetical protein JHK86_001347 [Glycine max]
MAFSKIIITSASPPPSQSKGSKPQQRRGGSTVVGDDEDTEAHIAPIVKLEELYRFDKDENQWKEQGTGTVKFLKHKASGNVSHLMRQSKMLKICANHLILPTMSAQEHAGNEKSCVFY